MQNMKQNADYRIMNSFGGLNTRMRLIIEYIQYCRIVTGQAQIVVAADPPSTRSIA